ncbi:MAG TPA: flippase activity-associated protein Agl23 [Lacunisphaera sp.]|nr:flippase activity-associated protein Agl23 [Lacunisphaera sp.]
MNASTGSAAIPRPRVLDGLLLAVVLAVALALRVVDLGRRPMHADEANQAVKVGRLLEGGGYRYDPSEHHGPTLYYLALISARLRGQATLASLSETTVRLVPALAGTAVVALLWLLLRPWGRGPAFTAALLLAVAPASVYYSRYFVQETLLVTFSLGALAAGLSWWRRGGVGWAATTGMCFGLMLATKETALFFAAAALVALATGRRAGSGRRITAGEAVASLGAAVLVAAVFFASFGANPGGLRDALTAPVTMLGRATAGVSGHEKPWWYYGSLFVWQRNGGYLWDQTLFILPALAGLALAVRLRGLPRFLAAYTAIIWLVLSATPYKAPWLVINLVPGLCALAALALARCPRPVGLVLGLLVLVALGWQTREAVFQRPADPRNPFAYVHSTPDVKKVPALAAAAPPGPVKVISREYWPLPWYLRRRPEVGYWTSPPTDCDGALVFVEAQLAGAVRARMHGNYHEGFLGLRPGFVLVVFQREGP